MENRKKEVRYVGVKENLLFGLANAGQCFSYNMFTGSYLSLFFVKVFGDHVEYSDPNTTKESIEEEYDLVPVPEGYVCTYEARLEKDLQKNYTDDDGNIIQFSQSCADYISSSIDNEHGEFFEKEIGGKTVRIHYVHDVEGGYFGAYAAWVENGYYFELVYGSEIELEVFEQWVASVQIKP